MKRIKQLLLMITTFTILLFNISPFTALASTTVYVNQKASIPITVSWNKPGAGFYFLSTGQTGTVGDPMADKYVKSVTVNAVFTPTKVGKQTITVKLDISDSNANLISVPEKKVTVNVVEKPKAPKPKPEKPQSRPPQIDDTEREKAQSQQQKTPEELEREELERRMKTPLIKEIKILSNSERLKGEVLNTIEPESEKFEYSAVLPWNIEDVSLDIRTIKDDVKLDYSKDVSFDPDKDTLEVVIKATQDKLKQEFKLTLRKPEESKFVLKDGSRNLRQIVDSYLDKSMEDLGFEKVLIDKNDPSLGFYYLLNNQRFFVGVEGSQGAVYLIDDKFQPIREVFLVSNKDKQVSILVNEVLDIEDERTFLDNEYEEHEIVISQLLTDLDPSIKFNNLVGGWFYDEGKIISHALDKNDVELVYVDREGNVKSAFVSFDVIPEKGIDIYAIIGFGLWIITSVAFIIYAVRTSKKLKTLSYYDI